MKLKCIGLFILFLLMCGRLDAAVPEVVLVFPLENMSGNAGLGWMSEGISELLATRLVSPTRYILPRSELDTAFEQLGLPVGTPLTLASEYKVARTLGASVAIVGHFTVVGDHLTTDVQWLNVLRLQLSRPIAVTGKLTDLDELETRLAWELLRSQNSKTVTATETEFSYRFAPVRLDAFESYIRGILSANPETQVHFLQESDRLNPRDHHAAFALGRYYYRQKNYTDSAKWLSVVNSREQDYKESLFLLGMDQYFLGQEAPAEITLRKLAGIVPLSEVLNNLGVVELRLGHDARAFDDFKKALQKEQTDADYAYNMSVVLCRMKKYAKAAHYLHKILAEDPEDADAHALLADVSGKLGDVQSRQSQLAWISDHNQSDGDDPTDGRNGMNSALQPSPRIKRRYDGRAFQLLLLTMTREAESRLAQEPIQMVHADGQTRLQRGRALVAAGRLDEAEQELVQAVLLLPESSAPHEVLGEVYEKEGKYTLAATELQISLKEKDSPQAHLWLARAYIALDHLEPALQQAQTVLQLDSTNAEAKDLVEQIRTQLSVHRDKP